MVFKKIFRENVRVLTFKRVIRRELVEFVSQMMFQSERHCLFDNYFFENHFGEQVQPTAQGPANSSNRLPERVRLMHMRRDFYTSGRQCVLNGGA